MGTAVKEQKQRQKLVLTGTFVIQAQVIANSGHDDMIVRLPFQPFDDENPFDAFPRMFVLQYQNTRQSQFDGKEKRKRRLRNDKADIGTFFAADYSTMQY
jgi:hypothetical protein